MPSPALPAELQAALAAEAEGLSRHATAERAALISRTYRDGGGSQAIRSETDALAYALSRMPGTYAAVAASLDAVAALRPGFAPAGLIDIGAGPGTASWAAAEAFGSIASFQLLDRNAALAALAQALARGSSRLHPIRYDSGDAAALLAAAEPADLVIASYVIGEVGEAERTALVALAWQRTRDLLLIVEPGTPAGTQRILAARGLLLSEGGHVLAPCAHQAPCPLAAPDWCHFSQRLPRLRAHKQVKQVDAPFEDEKFVYLAVARQPVPRAAARVLARPVVAKAAVTAKLCAGDGGLRHATVPRRDKAAFAAARRWDWGDAVDPPDGEG